MSASLVGSEMCIRDRCGVSQGALCWDGLGLAGSREGWGRGARASGSVRAVSYTHLTLPTICSV
eukprot:93527-Alexandrium_andersonii.AAC.1